MAARTGCTCTTTHAGCGCRRTCLDRRAGCCHLHLVERRLGVLGPSSSTQQRCPSRKLKLIIDGPIILQRVLLLDLRLDLRLHLRLLDLRLHLRLLRSSLEQLLHKLLVSR